MVVIIAVFGIGRRFFDLNHQIAQINDGSSLVISDHQLGQAPKKPLDSLSQLIAAWREQWKADTAIGRHWNRSIAETVLIMVATGAMPSMRSTSSAKPVDQFTRFVRKAKERFSEKPGSSSR